MGFLDVKSRTVRGQSVIWEDHRRRLVYPYGFGKNIVVYHEDFINFPVDDTTGDPTAWTCTMVEGGTGNSTFASTDASGGAGLLTTDDAENDGVNAQLLGESFKFKSTVDLYMGFFGITVSEATQSDMFLGLCPTDTAILTNDSARCGFQSVDGSTDFYALAGQTADASSSLHTLSTTAFDAELYWNGTALEAFIDGASGGAITATNIATGECRVSLEWLVGQANSPVTLQIDKIVVVQIGR